MVCKPTLIVRFSACCWPALCAALLGLLGPGMARAQPDAEDRTFERAGHIATQPARDVGLAKEKIPPILQEAVKEPYKPPTDGRCSGLVTELAALDKVLGPDFDASRKGNEDKATQLAEAGGEMVVNSLIPFRGLVRVVSGAAAADRRMSIAIKAGLARRGYLRGLAQARACRLAVTPPAK